MLEDAVQLISQVGKVALNCDCGENEGGTVSYDVFVI